MVTIWALFSVQNNYDQPMHNLDAWWPGGEKPPLETVAKAILGPKGLAGAKDEDVVSVVKVWAGEYKSGEGMVNMGGAGYRLVEIQEGNVTEDPNKRPPVKRPRKDPPKALGRGIVEGNDAGFPPDSSD